jgi:NADH-quinone oxidoreductase subunit B
VLDGLLLLQDKIARGDMTPGVVKPRRDPADQPQIHEPLARGAGQ